MFYSTAIFRSVGLSGDNALYATIGMGVINVAMTMVALVLVERAGRRTLLLIGYCGMVVLLILLTIFMLLFVRQKKKFYKVESFRYSSGLFSFG
jgi:MFS transporter, SP family, solute carrier family 2 (facilitated glucose transporter), member 1